MRTNKVRRVKCKDAEGTFLRNVLHSSGQCIAVQFAEL